jgi:hypothetical protein
MEPPIRNFRTALGQSVGSIALTLAFGIAHTQHPLYTANQNSYFLHGLKTSALPLLANDWMANTVDPFPLFSWLVRITSVTLPPFAFYVYQALLLGAYAAGVLGIACKTLDIKCSGGQLLLCFLLFTGLHSAALADLSLGLSGKNVVQLVDSGFAQQSIISQEFIPSAFGVLLIVSIYAFLAGKPLLAGVLASLAASFHSSYLLSSAVLILVYAVLVMREESNKRKALFTALLGFALLLPSLLYIYGSFRPASEQLFASAQEILVHMRIPRHADPGKWSSVQTTGTTAVILLGLYLAKGRRVFPLLLLAFITGTVLTLVQIFTSDNTLALLFPWRISTWLAPVSWGLIVAAVTKGILAKNGSGILARRRAVFNVGVLVLMGILAAYGGGKMYHQFVADPPASGADPMMHFVSTTAAPGQLYMVPTEMEDFRLRAGVPILVDWKTHPYKDTEVIEWHQRLLAANQFYAANSDSARELLRKIRMQYGVTHLVLPNRPGTAVGGELHELYRDSAFAVFEIQDQYDKTPVTGQ